MIRLALGRGGVVSRIGACFCFNGGRRMGEAYPFAMLEVGMRWREGFGM